jgi:hypothetical protein
MLLREERDNNSFTSWEEIKLQLRKKLAQIKLKALEKYIQEKLKHKEMEESQVVLEKEYHNLAVSEVEVLTKKK